MITAIKNIWRMGKFLPLLISNKDITIVPNKRLDIDNVGEIFMSDKTWHVMKEKGLDYERATITYSPGDDNYSISARAGGSGALRPVGIRSNVNNESIHIGVDGYVGINNLTPAHPLDVKGQVEINPSSAAPPLIIGGNGDGVLVDGLNVEMVGGKTLSELGAPVGFVYESDTDLTRISSTAYSTLASWNNSGQPAGEKAAEGDVVTFYALVELVDSGNQVFNHNNQLKFEIDNQTMFETNVGTLSKAGNFFMVVAEMTIISTTTVNCNVALWSDGAGNPLQLTDRGQATIADLDDFDVALEARLGTSTGSNFIDTRGWTISKVA